MGEFRMPSLGADMQYGTLVEWYVEPGEAVRRGQIIALVDTHKGAIEIEVFDEGIVQEIVVGKGQRVPVGAVMARLGPAPPERPEAHAGPPPQPLAGERPTEAGVVPKAAATIATPPVVPEERRAPSVEVSPPRRYRTGIQGTGPGGAITLDDVRAARPAAAKVGAPPVPRARERPLRATPVARRMAEQLGIDLGTLRGTGERGAIVKADVERAAAGPPVTKAEPARAPVPARAEAEVTKPAPAPDRTAEMRQAIAAAVARSKREIPHYYLSARVDMGPALEWISIFNRERAAKDVILPAALQLRAVALALREFRDFNGFWVDGAFRSGTGIHVGVAISLRGGGLVVPAIHDADGLSVEEIMRALADVVARARTGKLRSSELTDATITVTNLGDRGVDMVFGVIYPPQVALVGFGRITEQPWAHEGMVGARPVVNVTLCGDHRASDGHRGGLFLSAIASRLTRLEVPDKVEPSGEMRTS
jgi:pyruvate dehydrogenase E2 component (dihydrolipoamide acetyltransferase)